MRSCASQTVDKKARIELPVPEIHDVPGYEERLGATFKPPSNYIRRRNLSVQEEEERVEYDLRYEDMEWLRTHPRFGERADPRERLDEDSLEKMIDLMEKDAGSLGRMITQKQAEQTLSVRMPQLRKDILFKVLPDVYTYWVQARQRLKKPLLRRFWPVTSVQDTNPHNVFRPREKERYKLRRHRRNDMDSYNKLRALMFDLVKVRELTENVRQREQLKRHLLEIAEDQFDQCIYDLVDTSGKPRKPRTIMERVVIPRVATQDSSERAARHHPHHSTTPSAQAAAAAAAHERRRHAQQSRRRARTAGSGAPLARPRPSEREYEDGLGLGLAFGLRLGGNYIAAHRAPATEDFFGRRIAKRDHGGVGVLFRGRQWEKREGMVVGVGGGAGQSRAGNLDLQPERTVPNVPTYPPPIRVPGTKKLSFEPEPVPLPAAAGAGGAEAGAAADAAAGAAAGAAGGSAAEPEKSAAKDDNMGEDSDSDSAPEVFPCTDDVREQLRALLPSVDELMSEWGFDDVDLLAGEVPVSERVRRLAKMRAASQSGVAAASAGGDDDGYDADFDAAPIVLRPRVGRGGRIILDRLPLNSQAAIRRFYAYDDLVARRDKLDVARERRRWRKHGSTSLSATGDGKPAPDAARRKRRRLEGMSRTQTATVMQRNRRPLAQAVANSVQQARAVAAATADADFDPLALLATPTSDGFASSTDEDDGFEALAPYGMQPNPVSKGGILEQMFAPGRAAARRAQMKSKEPPTPAAVAAAADAAAANGGLPVPALVPGGGGIPPNEPPRVVGPLKPDKKRLAEIMAMEDSEDEAAIAMVYPSTTGVADEPENGRADWDLTLVAV